MLNQLLIQNLESLMKTFLTSMLLAGSTLMAMGQQSYIVGSSADVSPTPLGGILLAGGAGDNDDAMTWLVNRANGGDVVVLRAAGTDAYNSYLDGLGSVNSVETIVISSRNQANAGWVETTIRNAEAVFIAGGDQADYVNFWEGTGVEDGLDYLINTKGGAVGGTSAGCAIQGQVYFSAVNGTTRSEDVLANPYNSDATLGNGDFLDHSLLANTITDTHFDNPDRRGRIFGFMARMVADYGMTAKGIGVDEYTAV
ncbi:MAG TPA: cyanophycinase, partial [Cytophagales bacterium]|nr:cyanophycinase [Cytophagales bacterium]